MTYKFEVSTSSHDALRDTRFILPKQLKARWKFRNQTSVSIGEGWVLQLPQPTTSSHEIKRHLLLERKAMTNLAVVVAYSLSLIQLFLTPWTVACTSRAESSVHGISQARILEWVTISFSRGSSQSRDQTCIACIGRQILYHWATNLGSEHIRKQIYHFANKDSNSKSCGFFPSSHVWMWKLIHKEGWVLKTCCCLIVVLEKTVENSLDCKEIKRVDTKGNQPWLFAG